MYEIYIEEQMNLEILAHEDEKEKDIVLSQRANNLDKWKLTLDNLVVSQLKEKEEKEKEEKIDDLMSQL
jgi:cell division septal protein FtsQ